jgi:anti-anti-sigma regulatory factor
MSKDDSNGGFLSKVVKFVRHPTTSWSDLDTRASDRESEYSKAALKEMIERKRRNDFVRKREFDMLRKIRSREVSGGDNPGLRPSFFQSSMPSKPDDRAMTLKKIDEIEAQMSMQWWKTKGPDSSATSGGSTIGPSPVRDRQAEAAAQQEAQRRKAQYGETEGSPLDPAAISDLTTVPMQPTEPMPLTAGKAEEGASAGSARRVPQPRPDSEISGNVPLPETASASSAGRTGLMAPRASSGVNAFSASHFYALDVQEIAQDPEVEEAAIRFANGDDAGAEQGLLEVLGEGGPKVDVIDDWLALFDLYRASGQLVPFESRAVDFVNRFGRSAPQWLDMPGEVSRLAGKPVPAATGPVRAAWVCDQELDAHAVGTLQNVLLRVPQPWVLDWSALETIDLKAARALLGILTLWGDQDVSLRFSGGSHLRDVLKELTPSGRRDVEQLWWELRMALLRVMNRPDEFELTALDFCVTYEVSPPGWERPRCDYASVSEEEGDSGSVSVLGESVIESVPTGESAFDSQGAELNHLGLVELSGEIRGDPQAILDQLDSRLKGADVMIISCRHLIRVDFSAAGTLLNWVSAHHAERRIVQFVDVHRLVSAFFHVIGITEYAKVVLRND